MKLEIITEIWNMTRDSLLPTELGSAAENLVAILIDHDYSANDIKAAFRGDYDITSAIQYHFCTDLDLEEDDQEYDDEYYDDDSDN